MVNDVREVWKTTKILCGKQRKYNCFNPIETIIITENQVNVDKGLQARSNKCLISDQS